MFKRFALTALAALSACASQKRANYEHALAAPIPPDDFWLAVTVLRPPAEAASRAAAYKTLPIANRPARYVVEADRILRAATGSGASEVTFPDQTRQLSDAQFDHLWETLRASSLVKPDNPALVGSAPPTPTMLDKTIYIVSFAAAGNRRTLAFDDAAEAQPLIDELAKLAWVQ
jgi:hypothetical protein